MKRYNKILCIFFILIVYFSFSYGQNPQLWGTTSLGGSPPRGKIIKINGDELTPVNIFYKL
ncbi:MAG: hypothetical protein ABI855_08095, partial [Bacteroidota bacterium]